MSGHWKDGSSELDIGGVGGGFGGGGAGRRSRSGMMLGLQVMTVRAKELVIMSAAVGARGIINGLFEALQSGTHACACAHDFARGISARVSRCAIPVFSSSHTHMCLDNE